MMASDVANILADSLRLGTEFGQFGLTELLNLCWDDSEGLRADNNIDDCCRKWGMTEDMAIHYLSQKGMLFDRPKEKRRFDFKILVIWAGEPIQGDDSERLSLLHI